jgi:serine/threonine protein kinase
MSSRAYIDTTSDGGTLAPRANRGARDDVSGLVTVLTPGARFGHYEVTGSLGKGGMGEVHRARDTRLGRDVALKVLPDDVASDSGRMARFEREARLLAALNHPHIAAIYGVEEQGETRALVIELAEGATLQDRLSQGPVPVDEALPIATSSPPTSR